MILFLSKHIQFTIIMQKERKIFICILNFKFILFIIIQLGFKYIYIIITFK